MKKLDVTSGNNFPTITVTPTHRLSIYSNYLCALKNIFSRRHNANNVNQSKRCFRLTFATISKINKIEFELAGSDIIETVFLAFLGFSLVCFAMFSEVFDEHAHSPIQLNFNLIFDFIYFIAAIGYRQSFQKPIFSSIHSQRPYE